MFNTVVDIDLKNGDLNGIHSTMNWKSVYLFIHLLSDIYYPQPPLQNLTMEVLKDPSVYN